MLMGIWHVRHWASDSLQCTWGLYWKGPTERLTYHSPRHIKLSWHHYLFRNTKVDPSSASNTEIFLVKRTHMESF
eukprot:Gb_17879 [translate_table: standard]